MVSPVRTLSYCRISKQMPKFKDLLYPCLTAIVVALSPNAQALTQCVFNQDLFFDPDLFPNPPNGYIAGPFENESTALFAAKQAYFGPSGVYPVQTATQACKGQNISMDLLLVSGAGASEIGLFDTGDSFQLAAGQSLLVVTATRAICDDYGRGIVGTRQVVYAPGYVLTCRDASPRSISLTSIPEVRPAGTGGTTAITLTARVTTGAAPKPGVPVGLAVEVKPNSGGHDHHDATRPKGKLSAAQGVTDANGEVNVTFTAPEVSGVYTIKATCETCVNNPASREVKVKIPELLNIFALPFRDPKWAYPGIGQIPGRHTDNHYLTIAAATRLLGLAQKFNKIWPDAPRLTLNDASLEWGGKFDIPATWERNPLAHAEHRLGDNIDVRANSAPGAVPSGIRDTVFRWLRKASRRQENIPPEFVIESVNPLWENAGTQNEHFHLRLGN